MAGFLLPMLLDAIGGGGSSGFYGLTASTSTTTTQDASADSNVWHTSGPSANHGSINLNFHVNNENFTTPTGSTSEGGVDPQRLEKLMQHNAYLKGIIEQIAPSVITKGTRRKRSATRVFPPLGRSLGIRPPTRIACARSSQRCFPRGPNKIPTTKRPFTPYPLLRADHKPSDSVLDYFEKVLRIYRGNEIFSNSWKLGGIKRKGKIH